MLLECPRCRVRVEPARDEPAPRCASCGAPLAPPREAQAPIDELEHLPTERRVVTVPVK